MEKTTRTQRECEQRVAEEYLSSLSDLNCNSKPLINMLTMLAEENIVYAAVIVKVVEQHIAKVPPEIKLPILYLIDSIVKNVKNNYVQLFSQCIVNIFCGVFEKVNEKIRERMYALRQTWNEVFSAQKLYALDVKVKRLDNNWPITAKQPSIHVNPIFLKTANQTMPTEMEKILQDKTRELLELKKRKLELELEATMKHLEEQEKQICKTAEGVLPPVEALVAANALQNVAMQQPQHLPPQVMTGVMAPTFVGPRPMINPLRPPAMYHHNIRNFRPNMPPVMINDQQAQGLPPPPSSGNNTIGSANRPRVHPVNSALISLVRQRDPRLARQHQQQQQSSQFPASTNNVLDPTTISSQQQISDSTKGGKNERSSSHKSNRKSPTRASASSSNSSSSNRSSQRSSKSSSRDKDRDRKQRSESKSSSSFSSSTSLAAAQDRKKHALSSSKSGDKHQTSSKCDKDAFEIAPLSSAFKRKSSSPSSSPGKLRDSKRSHKSFSTRSKTTSRSPSPTTKSENYNDVDLRKTSTSSATSLTTSTSPEKRTKLVDSDNDPNSLGEETKLSVAESVKPNTNVDKTLPLTESTGKMDIDLRPHLVVGTSTSAAVPMQIACHPSSSSLDIKPAFSSANCEKMTSSVRSTEDLKTSLNARTIAISSSPKVSFKIQKNFNKLEKSTENLLSAAGPTSLSAALSSSTTTSASKIYSSVKSEVKDAKGDIKDEKVIIDDSNNKPCDNVSRSAEEDGKKRSSAPIEAEEPLAKKSKSTKIDNLFGSEDVDLRKLMPPLASTLQDEAAPPPPPFKMVIDANENWSNLKGDNSKMQSKKSNLDDVRAKLAKTARLNKLLKTDKQALFEQRNKLAELQTNEDTQEANDEKIRTMITQAQELLESNSITQDQFKDLLRTVMSINEVNKLKEAKRRESLNILKQKLNDDGGNDSERNAARDAILKKRIPKMSKTSVAEQPINLVTDSLSGDGSNSCGPMDDAIRADDKPDSNDDTQIRSNRREKRGHKTSKWGERAVESPPAGLMMPTGQLQQRQWHPVMGPQNKRGCGPLGFRPIAPHNVRGPWPPMNNNNMSHFAKGVPPTGGHVRNNALPPAAALPMQMPQPVAPKPCNSIDNPQEDMLRSITIDGVAKEIRFYDDIAIVFMELDQPREIGFQNGQRTIYIDNNEPINLQFNSEHKAVVIDGETLNLRFGYPSRELYIDDNWYEIYFGGPAIAAPVRNKIHMIKAEGPPPQVNIGPIRRDLVVGKINMIVDAHNVVPLFLDARLQRFKLGNQEHNIQFADNLLTVLLDATPTRVEYGGLPKSLFLGGKKYFIRFGALPQGVVAGNVQIKNMLYVETSPPPKIEPVEAEQNPNINTQTVSAEPTAPLETEVKAVELQKTAPQSTSMPILPAAALSNINIDELFQKLVSTGILGGSSGVLPAVNTAQPTVVSPSAASKADADTKPIDEENLSQPSIEVETINPIDLSKPESIKTRQASIVATLYSGMQCSSCGVRFPPEQTIKYSQHLDWHFRQNRRERDSSRKAHARKWYYDLNDWIQYEEVEDVDEREKNFFDTQQNDPEIIDDTSNQRSTNSPIPSCPAGSEDVDRACDMCQEKFEHFYNEELEEWHLRGAMRVEDKIYHPLCYEDYKASLNPPIVKASDEDNTAVDIEEPSLIQIDDDNAVDIVIKSETDDQEAKIDEEDDDVIVLPNEEPLVTEIYDDDDDEYVPANVTREHMGDFNNEENADLNETNESDVEIQEPHIPFTDLDTYVEKDLTTDGGESAKIGFMKMKIKEEPKEDEDDEDDGFEDVGTVLIAPDEISIHSSEETQTQLIDSSTSAMSPLVEQRPSSTSPSAHNEENETSAATNTEMPATDLNISMDGNFETSNEHNLSAVGPLPSVPLASLVNKIKINITKNTVTTSSSANSSNSAAAKSANSSCKGNIISSVGDQSKSTAATANPIPTISTIPVLCGGGTTISSTHTSSMGGIMYDEPSSALLSHMGADDDNSVSTISVIGSIYGNNGSAAVSRSLPPATTKVTIKAASPTPPPVPVEETIEYELKPALQKVTLKKKEKIMCGNETSGLCSIM